MDLVVATPGRLAEHLAAGTLTLSRCRSVVLDETDVLLGDAGAFREQARCSHASAYSPCPKTALLVPRGQHVRRPALTPAAPLALTHPCKHIQRPQGLALQGRHAMRVKAAQKRAPSPRPACAAPAAPHRQRLAAVQPHSDCEPRAVLQVEPLRAAAPPGARFVLVTATLPEAVYQAMLPLFPGLVPVLGPGAPTLAAVHARLAARVLYSHDCWQSMLGTTPWVTGIA